MPAIQPRRPGLAPVVPTVPWWRFPIAWLAVGLPASAVLAATASAVIAIRHADPVVAEVHGGPQPAEVARNHAATPRR